MVLVLNPPRQQSGDSRLVLSGRVDKRAQASLVGEGEMGLYQFVVLALRTSPAAETSDPPASAFLER
jgi:hypothetical protein